MILLAQISADTWLSFGAGVLGGLLGALSGCAVLLFRAGRFAQEHTQYGKDITRHDAELKEVRGKVEEHGERIAALEPGNR